MQRLQMRIIAWGVGIVAVVAYSAYKANPTLAIGSGVGMAVIAITFLWLGWRAEKRVQQMVEDVDRAEE